MIAQRACYAMPTWPCTAPNATARPGRRSSITAWKPRALERLEVETELRQALQRDELRVFYQPIRSLADGRIVEFEALIRWAHPVRGLLAAGAFVPLAEETGLIVPIGEWVLERGVQSVAHLAAAIPDRAAAGDERQPLGASIPKRDAGQ